MFESFENNDLDKMLLDEPKKSLNVQSIKEDMILEAGEVSLDMDSVVKQLQARNSIVGSSNEINPLLT